MNNCRPSALHVESNTPRENTRSSIGTGAACGSAGDVRLFGSVTGRAGVAISAIPGVDARSSDSANESFMMDLPPEAADCKHNPCDGPQLLRNP